MSKESYALKLNHAYSYTFSQILKTYNYKHMHIHRNIMHEIIKKRKSWSLKWHGINLILQ